MTLFEIADNFKQLFDVLEDEELSEEEQQAFWDTLDMVDTDFSDKAENIVKFIKNLDAEAKALREQEKKFAERRKVKENRIASLKKYLMGCMTVTDTKRIDVPSAIVTVRNNAESAVFADEAEFIKWAESANCTEFLRYKTPEIDKTAVKNYLQAGHELNGVKLERSQSLTIK